MSKKTNSQGSNAVKAGKVFENETRQVIYTAFPKDNVIEISGEKFRKLQADHSFQKKLQQNSYLVSQCPYMKTTGTKGYLDWAYYSEKHPHGIGIECVSQTQEGSKGFDRLAKDVYNTLSAFDQKHKIIVFGGELRDRLKKDAAVILEHMKKRIRVKAGHSHVITVDRLRLLLRRL